MTYETFQLTSYAFWMAFEVESSTAFDVQMANDCCAAGIVFG